MRYFVCDAFEDENYVDDYDDDDDTHAHFLLVNNDNEDSPLEVVSYWSG